MFRTLKELKKSCQKEKEFFRISKYFYRPLSLPITSLIVKTSISANTITVIGILTWIAGCFLLCLTEAGYQIAAVILLQLGLILDHVDGDLARYRNRTSYEGAYLDLLGHSFSGPLLFLCWGLNVFFSLHYSLALYLGIIGSLSTLPLSSNCKKDIMFKLLQRNRSVSPEKSSSQVLMKETGFLKKLGDWERIVSYVVKIAKPFGEFIGFPGCFIAVSLAVILDLVFPVFTLFGHTVNIKLLLLLCYTVLLGLNLLKNIIKDFLFMKRLHISQ